MNVLNGKQKVQYNKTYEIKIKKGKQIKKYKDLIYIDLRNEFSSMYIKLISLIRRLLWYRHLLWSMYLFWCMLLF